MHTCMHAHTNNYMLFFVSKKLFEKLSTLFMPHTFILAQVLRWLTLHTRFIEPSGEPTSTPTYYDHHHYEQY